MWNSGFSDPSENTKQVNPKAEVHRGILSDFDTKFPPEHHCWRVCSRGIAKQPERQGNFGDFVLMETRGGNSWNCIRNQIHKFMLILCMADINSCRLTFFTRKVLRKCPFNVVRGMRSLFRLSLSFSLSYLGVAIYSSLPDGLQWCFPPEKSYSLFCKHPPDLQMLQI